MKEHNVDADKVFRLMDDNKTGLVSFDEFQEWIFKITSRKFTAETVSKYYKGFKEPLNIKNFLMRINQ
jgi:Ca2+-binding EF-hand superfamily protein